jgi:hypothetical protein
MVLGLGYGLNLQEFEIYIRWYLVDNGTDEFEMFGNPGITDFPNKIVRFPPVITFLC